MSWEQRIMMKTQSGSLKSYLCPFLLLKRHHWKVAGCTQWQIMSLSADSEILTLPNAPWSPVAEILTNRNFVKSQYIHTHTRLHERATFFLLFLTSAQELSICFTLWWTCYYLLRCKTVTYAASNGDLIKWTPPLLWCVSLSPHTHKKSSWFSAHYESVKTNKDSMKLAAWLWSELELSADLVQCMANVWKTVCIWWAVVQDESFTSCIMLQLPLI